MIRKRIALIVVFTIMVSNVIVGQNSTFVSESPFLQDCNLSLILNEEKDKYCLLLGCWTSDDSYGFITVSYGNCETSRRKITTIDYKNGFQMTFKKRCGDVLVLKKGFAPLANMSFKYDGESTFDISDLFDAFSNYDEDRDNFRSKEYHSFKQGKYQYGVYCIELFNDGHYQYKIRDILFSSGKYEREGRLLQFFDTGLDAAFYGIIKSEGIESRFFPGELRGMVFKLISR